MRVQHVESLVLRGLEHRDRERERVRRILEERIRRNVDFVVVDVLDEVRQPERLRVADEMDLVSATRELDAELGGDDAGAAVHGRARDADRHTLPPLSPQAATMAAASSPAGRVASSRSTLAPS